MQYVAAGSVLVRVDSIAVDTAVAASWFVGTLAPQPATSSNVAVSAKKDECRRGMGVSLGRGQL